MPRSCGCCGGSSRSIHDPALTDAEKVDQVRRLLPADSDDEPAAVTALRQELDAGRGDDDYHDVLERRSLKLQNRVGPIIRVLAFQGEPAAAGLLAAIEHFKAKDGAVGRSAPHDFLEPAERAAVVRDGQVARASLYKALLFAHIARALKAGTLNLEHSYKYRPLDDYRLQKLPRIPESHRALSVRTRPASAGPAQRNLTARTTTTNTMERPPSRNLAM